MGLLGSAAYVAHPTLPLERAVAMINMDMIGRVRDGKVFVGDTATGTTAQQLAAAPERPQFVRTAALSGEVATASASNSGYAVYFGSVPDMSETAGGFRLADVRDGSPAAKAGLKGGDIMYEFAGTPIKDLYDFSQALRTHKAGDEVTVKWRRDGKEMEGNTTLATRK